MTEFDSQDDKFVTRKVLRVMIQMISCPCLPLICRRHCFLWRSLLEVLCKCRSVKRVRKTNHHIALEIVFLETRHSAAVWDHKATMEVIKGSNGIDQVVLRNQQGSSVQVSLQGGQITSWQNGHGEELLFTSSKVKFKPSKPARGGIVICFPQFENCGSLEQHGFARNKIWSIDENPPPLNPKDSLGQSVVDLLLQPSKEDLKCWPHSYELRLRVALLADGKLKLTSRVKNTIGKPFSFAFAYHSYLSVSDISEVRIEGMEILDYLDNLHQKERFTEQGDAITFESEVDRIYLKSPSTVAVLDHGKKRTCVIRKAGLDDVAVWNPWQKKATAMADLGAGEYKQMVCVDAAAVEKPIRLKAGEEWTGQVELINVASCFCSDTWLS